MTSKARRGLPFLALNLALAFCLLVLCTVQHASAQCGSAVDQPLVSSLDPPSGTTGVDETLGTTYTMTGERLDRVATIDVTYETRFSGEVNIALANVDQEPTRITFNLQQTSLSRNALATMVLQPDNTDCSSVTLEVSLHDTVVISLIVSLDAQPGTTIVAGRGTCLPNVCGDNSTTYDIIVGGIVLDKLMSSPDGFVARFPEFVVQQDSAVAMITTEYQTFTLPVSNQFDLSQQTGNVLVSPTRGQRGTRITITGEFLLGIGDGTFSAVVRIGGNIADLVSSSQELIELRANSGAPGAASIQINTTQTFNGVGEFDGPYTFLEDVWVQLEEGSVSDIIPPAVQTAGTVTLCGDSLLGGGALVASITLAGESATSFPQVPAPSTGSLPGVECISLPVPVRTGQQATGRVTIMSDTGATVDSIANFTFSEIQTVTPSRGQPGTIVTITGVALLSGYESATPTVNMSGIEAVLISTSSTQIVVRVTDPPQPSSGGMQTTSEVFGQPGVVMVTVTNALLSYSVTSSSPVWTYEVPGVVNEVVPNFGQIGTQITVTGTNLLGYGLSLTHTTIGESNATLIEQTDARVVLSTPDSGIVGSVNIVLFSENGAQVVGQQVFEYRERGMILNSEPNRGQRGTFVILTGSNLFGHGSNVTDVSFGGVSADIDYSQSNSTSLYTRVGLNENISMDTPVTITITADSQAIVQSLSDTWTYIVQGVVSNIEPPTGQEGTEVTITGTNLLGGSSMVTSVFVDGVPGTVESASDTSIVVSMGAIDTRQENFFPGQGYIMSATGATVFGGSYTQQQSGNIMSVVPLTGRRGTSVTIVGENLLGFGISISQVTVAGNVGRVISFNNTRVTVEAGPGDEAARGPVQLTINTGAVIRSAMDFTYGPPGIITAVTPAMGAEGSGVFIQGSALQPNNTQLTRVTVGGVPVYRIVTATTSAVSVIIGPAPSTNPDMAEIVLTASDGSFVDGIYFSFIDLVVTLPGVSSGREGTLLQISLPTASEFDRDGVLLATIDGEEADIMSSDSAMITVRVPRARRRGMFLVDVAVEDAQFLVARIQYGFTYLPEGAICRVTPDTGQMGTVVSLEGYNFLGGGAGIVSGNISGVPANIQFSNETHVVAQLAENLPLSSVFPHTGDILLTANTGATTRRLSSFELVQPGQILTVTPSVGQEGTRVTLSGTDLLQGSVSVLDVLLDGQQAIVSNATDTEITVEAAQSLASTQPGQVTVILSSGALIISSAGVTFEYLEPGEINTASPNVGTVGTQITITGSNLLGGGSGLDRVSLGGVHAMIDSFSNDMVMITAQLGTPVSLADIEIVSDTSARIVRRSFWTYEEIGEINSIEPAVGQRGIEVRIGVSRLGTAVSGVVGCRLAGIVGEVRSFTLNEVICEAGFFPDLASHPNNGSGAAQITTDTGEVITSNPNVTSFTYYLAEISQVQPSAGNNGTIVSIAGINLFGFPGEGSTVESVLFGDIPAEVIMSSANDLTVRAGLSPVATGASRVRITSSTGSFLDLDSAWTYSPPVQILAVIPSMAFSGAMVVLMGENLTPLGMSSVTVVVGQTVSSRAEIINSTTIEFQTGVYQSTDNAEEPLPLQLVYSSGQTVSESSVTFTYAPTPSLITAVQPNAGNGGARVRITGANLLNSQNLTRVLLAGVPISSVEGNATEEEIVVIAAPGPATGNFGTVVIETGDGLQSGLAGNAWRYYPEVDSVSPPVGQNGTLISIDLSGVDPLPTISNVTVAGLSVPVVRVDPSQQLVVSAVQSITMATPVGDIVVEFNDGSELVIQNAWSYLAPVAVEDVMPSLRGYFNTTLTLLGENYQAGGVLVSTVHVAGVQTTIESQSNTQLQVRITEPRDSSVAPFSGPVVISSSEGATYTSPFNFSYVQVRVDSVTPNEGQRGTIVSIVGVGLQLGGENIDSFLLGNVEAMLLNVSDTLISVSALPFPAQTNLSSIRYVMSTGAELSIPDSWRYIVPGEISSVSPEEGGAGTIVTIMGVNLFGGGDRAAAVLLNNVPAETIISNFNSFVQVTAGQSVSALTPGNVQIISNTGAVTETTSSVDFSYLDPGVVSKVFPLEGQNGSSVQITGLYLHNGEGVARVLIAGVEATIDNIDDNLLSLGFPTTISVRAGRPPNLNTFSGPITVISHFNTMSVSMSDFTYLSEGIIFTVTPPQGRNGTALVIAGENLLGGGTTLESVYLAGMDANVIGTPTNSRVEVRARSNMDGLKLMGNIVLISDTQAYVQRVDGWCYVQDGIVTDIQPPEGQYGTNITITGERLLSGGEGIESVSLDSVALEVLSSTNERVEARVTLPATPVGFDTSLITLVSNYGGILTLTFQWRFLNQSDITDVSPSNGTGDTMVTITGTNLLGGGSMILSALVETITAAVMSSNDSVVVIQTGFNTNGQQRVGDIVLVSDTGARTRERDSWTYINECSMGFYGNTDNCLPCDEECPSCFGPNSTDCYTCSNFAISLSQDNSTAPGGMECVPSCLNVSTLDRVCRDSCELSEYARANTIENATFCRPCHSQCDPNLSCSGPAPTQCGGCRNVFDSLNQTCIEACPQGTFVDEQRRCIPCDSQCVQEDGCFGPTSAQCNNCINVYLTTTLMDGRRSDFCMERCPSQYYQLDAGSRLCRPCDEECAVGCTGSSPFNCDQCANASFVFPNGTTRCVASCNVDPAGGVMYYEDTGRVCQPCSSFCSLTGGCFGPTAFDCFGCRRLAGEGDRTIPSLNGECLNSCPNTNRTYSFYADNSTNQCEACDRACEIGCLGPLPQDCFSFSSNVAGTVILVLLLIVFFVVALALAVYIVYQRKGGDIYKLIRHGNDSVELGNRYSANITETRLSSSAEKDDRISIGMENEAFTDGDLYSEATTAEPEERTTPTKDHPVVADEHYSDVKKSEGELGSQDLLYTAMDSAPNGVEYATPTPKALRKEVSSSDNTQAPPRPSKPSQGKSSKPPPPRPPSPVMDGEVYTDMEAGVQEVHINKGANEEYSEMSPAPVMDDVYDDVVAPANELATGEAPTEQSKDEIIPLLDVGGMYEDTDTAVAMATDYIRKTSQDQSGSAYKRLSGIQETPPELPFRPPVRKRTSVPLPETPLQKSLSGSSFPPTSPTHQLPPPTNDVYINPEVPIEECLYEAIPGTGPAFS